METMGERIAKARMYMNLNQRELAKKLILQNLLYLDMKTDIENQRLVLLVK